MSRRIFTGYDDDWRLAEPYERWPSANDEMPVVSDEYVNYLGSSGWETEEERDEEESEEESTEYIETEDVTVITKQRPEGRSRSVIQKSPPPDTYADQIMKTIPVEIVTLWLFIHELVIAANTGAVQGTERIVEPVYYAILISVIILTFFYLVKSTRDSRINHPPSLLKEAFALGRMHVRRKRQIQLGMIAFLIWVLYLGGPIIEIPIFGNWYNETVGAIFLAIFTASIPLIIPEYTPQGEIAISKREGIGTDPSTEKITFENIGDDILDMSGWTVRNSSGKRFKFPNKTTIQPHTTMTLHTGQGTRTKKDFYWGSNSTIWKRKDFAIIEDDLRISRFIERWDE